MGKHRQIRMKGAIILTLLMSTSLTGCIYVERQPETRQDSSDIDLQRAIERELDNQRRTQEKILENAAEQNRQIIEGSQKRMAEFNKQFQY